MDYQIDYGEIQDPTAKFEKGRIAVLAQERIHIQKKTFTKWCNSFLEKVSMDFCTFWSWFVLHYHCDDYTMVTIMYTVIRKSGYFLLICTAV